MKRRRPSVEHPCLSCTLPDCDDDNPRCGLKRAMAAYASYLRAGVPAPIEVLDRKNLAYNELHAGLRQARSDPARKARIREAKEAESALAAGRPLLRRRPVPAAELEGGHG